MAPRLDVLRTAGPAALGIGALGLGVLATGSAYAVWSTTGSGTASASASAALPVGVVVTVSGSLHPGARLSATPTFSNPNPFPVTVTSVRPGAVTVAGGAGCTAANSGVTFRALTGRWTVPAGGGATAAPVPDAVAMSTSSHTGCQRATFTAALTATGASS